MWFSWFSILIGLAVVLIVLYLKQVGSYWRRKNVIGPKPVPLFGNMTEYIWKRKHFGEVYHEIYKSYSNLPYVGIYKVLNKPAILLRDMDLIKDVMSTNFNNFYNNDFNVDRKLDPLLSQNPFAARDQNWKISRTNMAPFFTPMKIKMLYPMITNVCDKLIQYIEKNPKNVDVLTLCNKYTLEVVAACGFGVEANTFTDNNSTFVKMIDILYGEGSQLKTTTVMFLPALSKWLKMSYIPSTVNKWMQSMINDIIKMRNLNNENRVDFLQHIIDANDRKQDMTETMMAGYCLSMLLEGFEPSSGLMSYCLFEMASNPDIQKTAQREIDDVLLKSNGQINDETIQQMHYLDGICYETTRKYPSMYALNKLCTKQYELPPQNPLESKKNVLIEPGTTIIIPVFAIQFDSNYYQNPDEFDPTRFIGENRNKMNKYAFLSFGEGQRICIGMKFAMAQSKAGLATILSNFDVKFGKKQEFPLKNNKSTFIMICSNGIWLDFIKRNK